MPTKLLLQKTESGLLAPFAEPDQDILKEYSINQILQAELTGTRKPRSLEQLGTYWRLCKLLSENSDHHEFATPNKVDWRIRNALQFYDRDYTYYNTETRQVNFKVRSISYKNLKHLEACNYFEQAFDLISKAMKVPLDVLIDRSKKS